MNLDPAIYYIVAVPDGDPQQASLMQGFAPSLCMNSFLVRWAALLPSSIFDPTPEGQETFLLRRMAGIDPVNWVGQLPKTLMSVPNPTELPFVVVLLGRGQDPNDYREWVAASSTKPTIVAEHDGDLTYGTLSLEGLQARFLAVLNTLPKDIDEASVAGAREAIESWRPMPPKSIGYQMGGHNSISPNLIALTVAGYTDLVSGRFDRLGRGIAPYVEQIVRTTNSVLDEREKVGVRELNRIYRLTPDLTLFAPSIYPEFLTGSLPLDIERQEKRLLGLAKQALAKAVGLLI